MQKSKFIVATLALLLCGCSTIPAPKVVTQTVDVPIAMPCTQEIPPAPDYCFTKLTADQDIFAKSKCLLSDRDLSMGYELELLTKLKACK